MSRIYRKLIDLIMNAWAWILDYLYVAYWQMYGFFIRSDPRMYRLKKPNGTKAKVPIILIPGIYENWRFMKPIVDVLHQHGHQVHIVDGLGYNTGNIEDMAAIVDDYIISRDIHQWAIVAHSKGGLVGKYLLANHNTHKKIIGMVALNAPFSGSRYAYLMPLRSIRIFLPHSPIISFLTSNTLVNKDIISVFGQFDPHIPKGSHLEGAKNIQLKTRGHFRIMKNTNVHKAVIRGIEYLTDK